MKLLALFAWLLVPLGLWLAITIWGTPYLALTYRFYDNGRVYDPLAPRHYITCDWWGLSGVVTLPAENAHCPWVRFLKVAP